MTKEYDIQEEADKIVTAFTEKEVMKAYDRVEREMHHSGCGCHHCIHESVSEINSWMDWYMGDTTNIEMYRDSITYRINKKGEIWQGAWWEEDCEK